jgi:predicted ATP-dependent protease
MRRDTAATGFFSLTGDVHGIGGVNSKIRVAKSAGYKRVVIPEDNLIDVTEELKNDPGIEIVPVASAFQLLNACLEDPYSKYLVQFDRHRPTSFIVCVCV